MISILRPSIRLQYISIKSLFPMQHNKHTQNIIYTLNNIIQTTAVQLFSLSSYRHAQRCVYEYLRVQSG